MFIKFQYILSETQKLAFKAIKKKWIFDERPISFDKKGKIMIWIEERYSKLVFLQMLKYERGTTTKKVVNYRGMPINFQND